MRCRASLVVVLFAIPALHAQPRVGEVTIRGCIAVDPRGHLALTALDPSLQAFDSQNRVEEGQLFSLIGENATLDELSLFMGDEVEIEGHLNPENPVVEVPGHIVEPPVGIGIPGSTRPQASGGSRLMLSRGPAEYDEIEITAHKFLRPGCRSR